MWQLTTAVKTGLRMMVRLAQEPAGRPLSAAGLARELGVSPPYLEQLSLPLRRAALVRSVRGTRGGFVLARPAEAITVGEIVAAFEGPGPVCGCREPDCRDCLHPEFWQALESCWEWELGGVTLARFAQAAPLEPTHASTVPVWPLWEQGAGI
ncbi:Iron-sulfur cluster regulator IscR [Candidatus Hydrogenisulfobacillus filiaventi]|uniref:Iron-sulfur cluster regulator IscR n=1 Tax=Candidatus Hydrogenisulfobacillus filiaventi TaxID=2707344 RepID=A0A6F8ZDJ5_9FIRM|nr:Iron-sulfur cluster regulator IscR [Candidatus Hydrogenisulfobacillus filiaventi]